MYRIGAPRRWHKAPHSLVTIFNPKDGNWQYRLTYCFITKIIY